MQQYMPNDAVSGGAPGVRRETTLSTNARMAGALICAALLVVEIAWTVRDINAMGFHDTVWGWLNLQLPGTKHALLATGGLDGILVAVIAGAFVCAWRPGAAWAFVTAGLFAALFRIPALWVFTAHWSQGAPLRGRALATGIGFAVAGVALVLLGLLGREPVLPGGSGVAPRPPRRGPALAGGVVLLLLAVELAGWQFYDLQKYNDEGYPPHLYEHLLTGEGTLSSLLDAPFVWASWVLVALSVAAAVAAFRGAPLARPLGMAIGGAMFFNAVVALDAWHTEKMLFKFNQLPDSMKSQQVTLVFELVAGLLLFVLFVVRGNRIVPPNSPWAPQPPRYGQPGWGVPPQQPAPGGFGPPPPLPSNYPPGAPPSPSGPPSQPPGAGGWGPR
ncbi:hypothetical protein AB0M29_32430 [Streptomyces sp. NPDC051976]|uniref:hypothetical protein n=1 Tax=Streptomyces sp. NPDC051976 TaxID=3154947 RepID=UPI00342AD4F0